MFKRLLLASCFAVASLTAASVGHSAVVFTVMQNPDYLAGAGTFNIQVSTDNNDLISAMDLQFDFSSFTGVGSVNITSLSAPNFPGVSNPPGRDAVPFTASNGISWQGNFATGGMPQFAAPTAPAAATVITFSYTGLTPGSYFDVTPGTFGSVGVVGNLFGGQTISSSGVTGRVTAVPEPGSFAICGLMLAGVAGRRWRKNRK